MTSRFQIFQAPLSGLRVLERKPIHDDRGFVERLFCDNDLRDEMGGRRVVQINRTLTRKRGAVRGMHFQHPPHAELKIVTCLKGEVFDVALDLRRGSPTFLRWHGERLTEQNARMLFIPEGFAHGFQALSADCEMLYLHTSAFEPGSEGGVNVRDPHLSIAWPEAITELSARDSAHAMLTPDFAGIAL